MDQFVNVTALVEHALDASLGKVPANRDAIRVLRAMLESNDADTRRELSNATLKTLGGRRKEIEARRGQ